MPEQDVFQNDVEIRADIPQQAEVRQYVSSVSVGNVTTLPAGSQATVTNTGTEEHAIFDFGLPKGDAGSMWGELAGDISDQADLSGILTNQETAINAKAPLASPALTGTPTAPTAVDGTSSTQIATTAFVSNAVTNLNNALQTYVQNYVNTAVNKMLGRINYSGAVSFSATVSGNWNNIIYSDYTCPTKGYVLIKSIFGGDGTVFYINGKEIPFYQKIGSGSGTFFTPTLWPVSAGDKIRSAYTSTTSVVTGTTNGVFFPESN